MRMQQNLAIEDDEINLSEFVATLWYHKLLIALLTVLSILIAGNYALTKEKKFTAKAIFKIDQNDNASGFNLPGELGALASLAGFGSGNPKSSLDSLIERTTAREFIIDTKDKFSLESDPYFNSYNPNLDDKDPFWKATVKKLIGWQELEFKKEAIIEKKIIGAFQENVIFKETDSGSISISVTHVDRQKASDYTNIFMEEFRLLIETESSLAQEMRLNYLSETLADALQEMEKAQENLKNYALENSAMAQENFISDSLKLDEIRMEKRKVEEIADLLFIIDDLLKSGNLDTNSYETLRLSHPLVDDIDFRRILGMSETISAWTWPDIEAIDAVRTTLRDRIKRLDVEITNIEENATIYATSAEDLARYKRDAKIAEATYTVLIEQVKSQSLAAGYRPETFKVFQYATPPLSPSSPKRTLILAMGAVFGMFIGCVISLMNGVRRGVYYTRSALLGDADSNLISNSKALKKISRKSFSQVTSLISKMRIVELDKAALKLANKKIVYIVSYGGKTSSSNAVKVLALKSAQSGRNVVVCDTTGQSEKEIEDKATQNSSDLPTISIGKNISVLTGVNENLFFTSKNFSPTIKDLTDHFDQVFLCTSKSNAQLGLMALLNFTPGLVVIARLRRTKKSDIKKIKAIQPIDLLFND